MVGEVFTQASFVRMLVGFYMLTTLQFKGQLYFNILHTKSHLVAMSFSCSAADNKENKYLISNVLQF